MTVPSSTSRDQQAGNGVTTGFTVPFRILDQTHIRVLLTVAGVTTEQTLTTHYTVSGVGGASTTVTFVTAPPAASTVTFLRNVPLTQETDYVPNDPFPAESHERALDKLTMITQQLDESLDRSFTLPEQVAGVSTELPVPAARNLIGWNNVPDGLQNYTFAELATVVAYADKHWQTFTGTGAQVNFTLDSDPSSLGNLEVTIDGVMQVPTADFTYTGTTLTFVAAPANGAVILVRYDQALPTGVTDAAAVNYTPPSTGVLGSIKSFLDSLWTSGASTGAALIRFLQSGASAVARTVMDKLREVEVTAEDFGAVGNGVTDDLAAINAAMTEVAARGGGTVRLLAKKYGVSNKVAPPTGVKLKGAGCGQYPAAAFITSANFIALPKTRLLALAAFPGSTPVVECKPAADPLYVHQAMGIEGIMIDCANIAARGLDVISVKNSQFRDLLIFRPTSIGILEDVLPVADQSTEGNNATQYNDWKDITVWAGNTGSVVGWRQTGTTSHNINQNAYRNIKIVHCDGDGIDIVNGDTNYWTQVNTYAFGTGYGLTLNGHATDVNITARNNTFVMTQFAGPGAGQGGVRTTNPGQAPVQNRIYGYSTGNGTPDPVIANGTRLQWSPDVNEHIGDPVEVKLHMHRTDAWSAAPIGGLQMIGRLTGSSTDTNVGYLRMLGQGGAGTESTRWEFHTYQAAAQAIRGYIANGLVMGAPAGGDKGAGTINAQAVYDDNVLLTDYVFDQLLDGQINPEDVLPTTFDPARLDPAKYAAYWKEHRHLPAMPSREEWRQGALPTGAMIQRLWETVEVQAVHIAELHDRLQQLEPKVH